MMRRMRHWCKIYIDANTKGCVRVSLTGRWQLSETGDVEILSNPNKE
jgi:hypothetical protein